MVSSRTVTEAEARAAAAKIARKLRVPWDEAHVDARPGWVAFLGPLFGGWRLTSTLTFGGVPTTTYMAVSAKGEMKRMQVRHERPTPPSGGERYAGVYLTPEAVLPHAFKKARAGFLYGSPPVVVLRPDAPPAALGRALRGVLDAYVPNEPDPDDWKAARAEFLKATTFRSWKALEGGAKLCNVCEDRGRIVLTPTRNGGSRGDEKGFAPFSADPVSVPSDADEETVGRAVLEALSRCA